MAEGCRIAMKVGRYVLSRVGNYKWATMRIWARYVCCIESLLTLTFSASLLAYLTSSSDVRDLRRTAASLSQAEGGRLKMGTKKKGEQVYDL